MSHYYRSLPWMPHWYRTLSWMTHCRFHSPSAWSVTLGHVFPLDVSFPNHLKPHWSRIFYDHRRSHRRLCIFCTSEMSISGNFESYRRSNTSQQTAFTANDFYDNNNEFHNFSIICERLFHFRHYWCINLFLPRVLLERTTHLCRTHTDYGAQVMLLLQCLLNLMREQVLRR